MEILYKYAEDKNGKIIHINNVTAGETYCCPDCKEKFAFKKGKIRQQHFSHKNATSNCIGEGYLHKTFKKLLFELLKNHIGNKLQLEINWKCNICNNEHKGSLINGINIVKEEHDFGICRPDIVLFNEANTASIIIEIVDKHEPQNNVFEFCKKNNLVLIRIKLETINDLENIENKIKNPTNVVFYNEMNCPNYRINIANKNRPTIGIDVEGIYRRARAERSRRRF
jgi:hypothetical protein